MRFKLLNNKCREAFKIFDRNKDGMITLRELKKVTDILGTVLSKEEVDEFMKEADKVTAVLPDTL